MINEFLKSSSCIGIEWILSANSNTSVIAYSFTESVSIFLQAI